MDAYIKAVIALAMAILAALVTALGTGNTDFSDIDLQTWLIALGTVLASGALTYLVQNIQGVAGGIIKAVVAAFGAAIASLVTSLDDRVLSTVEQVTAISAFVGALALVYQIPNAEPEPEPMPTRTVRASA
jgi:hypothetical protein